MLHIFIECLCFFLMTFALATIIDLIIYRIARKMNLELMIYGSLVSTFVISLSKLIFTLL